MLIVFLPAYNEEVALGRVVEKFARVFKTLNRDYRIVVMDDGSKDATASVARDLAKQYPLELLQHKQNEGLGATMRDGLEHVAKNSLPNDVVITMDCDDTHDPQYVDKALAKIEEGYDVVILSRYQKGGGEQGLSGFRSVLSRGAGLFLKLFFPIKGVQEYSCGYRVFRVSILKKAFDAFGADFIRLPHMGFVVTPEILIKLRMLGARIAETPFVLQYGLKPGASKNKPMKTIGGYFALILLYFGRRVKNS